ncbi:MAG: quinolinate synthase NadA [Clostridiales bacterium]|nr:quinolinate synthase NadA [Clostridiales bacterium]
MLKDLQEEIIRLKKEKDICILAHSYQSEDILEVADFSGDSYALSVKAAKSESKTLLMCGVRFMAETAKLLSPGKKVIIANGEAGCPMAEQFTAGYIEKLKESKYKGYTVVAYINTTTELKSVCDVCVTSSSAVKIVNKIANKNILFIPDCNLGSFVKENCPDKNIALLDGGCPVHAAVTKEDAVKAKENHPNALLLVHPECKKEVTDLSDFAGSTADIMKFAENSENKEFIIGTENSIIQHLQIKCPDKKFYALSKNLICSDMKLTTLTDVYNAVSGTGGEEIILDSDIAQKAVRCINKMIELG